MSFLLYYYYTITLAKLAYAKQTNPEKGNTLRQLAPFPANSPLNLSVLHTECRDLNIGTLPELLVCNKGSWHYINKENITLFIFKVNYLISGPKYFIYDNNISLSQLLCFLAIKHNPANIYSSSSSMHQVE